VAIASLLVLFNIAAHFLPFERRALGNDDYALVGRSRSLSWSEVARLVPRQPNRPLAFLVVMMQGKAIGDHATRGLFLMLAVSSMVLLAVFALLRLLLRNTDLAALGAVCFVVIPNKLEIYHLPIYTFGDVGTFVYLSSFILMIRYAQRRQGHLLFWSVATYSVGILLYEPGFFLPVIFLVYLVRVHKMRPHAIGYFLIPASLYAVFRITHAFGFADPLAMHPHVVNVALFPRNLLEWFHHYGGRYLVRSVLYGVTQYVLMEPVWLVVVSLTDVVIAVWLVRWLRRHPIAPVEDSLAVFGVVVFVVFSFPNLINGGIGGVGGMGGRQLVLPSVGLAMVVPWLFSKLKRSRVVAVCAIVTLLVICQGNAWTQVVACRINDAVYTTMKEQREELRLAERIIIDTRSFADQIPFTWVPRDFNVLNTYYGAQTFENWGLSSMVRLAVGDRGQTVFVATERPQPAGAGTLQFAVSEFRGYRTIEKRVHVVPRDGTAIIDYQRVFGGRFHHGLRQASEQTSRVGT